jgi:putative PIN family toxin of toxin-antitoxin system
MIRAVLDTNVLASAFLRHGSPPDQALRAAVAGLYRLIISDHILEELSRTLVQPYFRARLSAEQLAANLEVIRLLSEHVSPTTSVRGVAPHPEDDLVTGDRAFLRVRQHQGTRLVTPQAFLVALAVQP